MVEQQLPDGLLLPSPWFGQMGKKLKQSRIKYITRRVESSCFGNKDLDKNNVIVEHFQMLQLIHEPIIKRVIYSANHTLKSLLFYFAKQRIALEAHWFLFVSSIFNELEFGETFHSNAWRSASKALSTDNFSDSNAAFRVIHWAGHQGKWINCFALLKGLQSIIIGSDEVNNIDQNVTIWTLIAESIPSSLASFFNNGRKSIPQGTVWAFFTQMSVNLACSYAGKWVFYETERPAPMRP